MFIKCWYTDIFQRSIVYRAGHQDDDDDDDEDEDEDDDDDDDDDDGGDDDDDDDDVDDDVDAWSWPTLLSTMRLGGRKSTLAWIRDLFLPR